MLTLVAVTALALSTQALILPKPSGPHSIGKTSFKAAGESVLIWYPSIRAGASGRYVSGEEVSLLVKTDYYGQSPEVIRGWEKVPVHSSEDAPVQNGRHPLLIFLPGAGVCGFQYTAFAEEFASRGYVVAVVDYYSPTAPPRRYGPDDWAAANGDLARVSIELLRLMEKESSWNNRIRFDQVTIAGHSIGGSAAIAATRFNQMFRAAIDLDGAPFGAADQGAVAPVLVLRSKPIYSDQDLARRGRTRKQMDVAGEEARKTWLAFKTKSATEPVLIYSVQGTGHFSFSDAPFTMPDAITRFGGKIIEPGRGQKVITTCMLEFIERASEKHPDWRLTRCEHAQEIIRMSLSVPRQH